MSTYQVSIDCSSASDQTEQNRAAARHMQASGAETRGTDATRPPSPLSRPLPARGFTLRVCEVIPDARAAHRR